MQKVKLLLPFYSTLFLISILFVSCGNGNFKVLPDITGRPGDLLVVIDTAYKNTQSGEAVMKQFASEQYGLPQREPLFNVVMVPHKAFTKILQSSRNVLSVNIHSKYFPGFSIQKEVWARGQVVINVFAPDDATASKIINANGPKTVSYLQKAEVERWQQHFAKIPDTKKIQEIENFLGFTLALPTGYLPMLKKENYLSLRQDKRIGEHIITQCISMWHYPFVSDSTFTLSNIITVRDSVTKKYQRSVAKNAYMEVYKELPALKNEINLNGMYATEVRGLWSMVNDFMGGPFVNYTFVDEKNARVICIDVYVFAPQFDKREYLRELEAIALSAKPVLREH